MLVETLLKVCRYYYRVLLAPMISRDHFFLAVFVRVTHDGQSERGATRSLCFTRQSQIRIKVLLYGNGMCSLYES